MKITFVLDNYPPHFGGAEKVFEQIVNHLAQKENFKIRVVTTSNTSSYEEVKKGNIEVYYYPWTMIMDHPIPKAKDIAPHVIWADIVHTATYSVSRTALRVAKRYDKKCIISPFEALRNKWYWIEPNPLIASLFRLFEIYSIKAKYDHFHVISQATKRDVSALGIDEKLITTAYPGINYQIWDKTVKPADLNSYLKFPPDKKVILYYGRPGKPKGIFVFLEAIRIIKEEIPGNIRFGFIMAKEPAKSRKRFQKLVQQYGLSEFVHIGDPIEWSPDNKTLGIANYVKAAHFVAVPSLTEGFGFCAAETCALNVPLIASTAGSLPEVVSGKHLFFENKNSNMLAEQLIKGIKGNFEQKPYKSFQWKDCVDKIEQIYKKVLS